MAAETRSPALVSILTPSFNQADFIGACLASVACQSYSRIEHVVYDGGSSDSTLSVVSHSSVAQKFVWRSEPDRGQSDALNKAFNASSGQIIGWLNSDDAYATRDAVAGAVEIFARWPTAGVVFGHAILVDSRGVVQRLLRVPAFSYRLLLLGCYLYQPSVFVRREALEQHGFVREDLQFAMDYDLWLRLAGSGVEFRRLNRFVAIDRHHAGRKVERYWPMVLREANSLRPPTGGIGRARWILANLALRESAVLSLPRFYKTSLLPSVERPPIGPLLLRQVAVPRRFMAL